MNQLQFVLNILVGIAQGSSDLFPQGTPADKAAELAAALSKIAAAAVQAHNRVKGEPLDLSKLHELPLV
jgi:hypothetical protein